MCSSAVHLHLSSERYSIIRCGQIMDAVDLANMRLYVHLVADEGTWDCGYYMIWQLLSVWFVADWSACFVIRTTIVSLSMYVGWRHWLPAWLDTGRRCSPLWAIVTHVHLFVPVAAVNKRAAWISICQNLVHISHTCYVCIQYQEDDDDDIIVSNSALLLCVMSCRFMSFQQNFYHPAKGSFMFP